jgi:hypothetical protein
MSKSEEPSKIGASPVKLALAAVLTVVFIAVLIVQFGGISNTRSTGRERGKGKDPTGSAQPTGAGQPAPSPPQPSRTLRTTQAWPILDIERVLEYDPFALPAPLSRQQEVVSKREGQREAEALELELARRRAEQEQSLAQLQEAGVRAILGGAQGEKVALVGSRVVRVGDELDGFRVSAIQPDGLTLQQPAVEQPANRTDDAVPVGSTHRPNAPSDPSSANRRRP